MERQLLQQMREAAEHAKAAQAMAETQQLLQMMDLDPSKSADSLAVVPTRPNAYVPDSEGSLPIPKPFGRHAPFKAAEPSPHLRQLRRPEAADSHPLGLGSDLVD